MHRTKSNKGPIKNLDSLVDIVSNIVGILVILAVFMALFSLIDSAPIQEDDLAQSPMPPLKKILVPWSHSTSKNSVFFYMKNNRLSHFNMRSFYKTLAKKSGSSRPKPVSIKQSNVKIRFFPVTSQVYCLEFQPIPGRGETWLEATRVASQWRKVRNIYPPEKFYYFFWVSGDSFELFREVRNLLWQENYEVGWKPVSKDSPLEICNGFEGSSGFQPQ